MDLGGNLQIVMFEYLQIIKEVIDHIGIENTLMGNILMFTQ